MWPMEKYISTSRKPTDQISRRRIRGVSWSSSCCSGRRLGRALFRRAVARRLHGGNNGGGLRRALYAHGIGQKAHRACRDAGDLPHRLFHPGRAGGAAHARNIVLPHGDHSYFISFCRVATSSSMTWSLPSRMSWATQVRIWLASSSLLKALMAAFTAAA